MRVTHLNGMRALEATLRTGNFRAAASELGVTPAAVGQQVKNLEAYLGCDLFIRTPTGVTATQAALEIEQNLTNCFVSLDTIADQLRNAKTSNHLAITMPSSFAENWFANRLANFYRLNSKLDLRLNASNRMIDLQAEGYDFAIRYGDYAANSREVSYLFGDHVLPVCTPGFAKDFKLSRTMKSLDTVPLIHLMQRTPDPEWADWRMWGDRFGIANEDWSSGIQLTDFNSGVQVALKGQGLVLCGLIEAYDAIESGELMAPFGPEYLHKTEYSYWLVEAGEHSHSEIRDQFKIWIIDQAKIFRAKLEASVSLANILS